MHGFSVIEFDSEKGVFWEKNPTKKEKKQIKKLKGFSQYQKGENNG